MTTRICNNCGQSKNFDAIDWRVSRGVPAGRVCKKCIALLKRGSRKGLGSLVIDFQELGDNKLLRIAKCISLLDELSTGSREPSNQFESKLITELQYSNFKDTCIKYIRGILADI